MITYKLGYKYYFIAPIKQISFSWVYKSIPVKVKNSLFHTVIFDRLSLDNSMKFPIRKVNLRNLRMASVLPVNTEFT